MGSGLVIAIEREGAAGGHGLTAVIAAAASGT